MESMIMMNNIMMNQMQMINMNMIPNNEESYEIEKYNIKFYFNAKASLLVLDKETTVKEMIETYLKKMCKSKDQVIFLYNAKRINIYDNTKIKYFFEINQIPKVDVIYK